MLFAEELFASGDSGFLRALFDVRVPHEPLSTGDWSSRANETASPARRRSFAPHPLGAFARRWIEDPRPWAREQLLAYVDDGCDRPGHRPLVKKLFKEAEARNDHELIGRFFVAFDRLRRVRVRTVKRFDPATRTFFDDVEVRAVLPRTEGARHFSQRTRNYLQARAVRYLRALAVRDPQAFRRVALGALIRYEDRDVSDGYALLRMRGLVTLLFRGSDVVSRTSRTCEVSPGRALAELEPAPLAPSAWKGAGVEILEALPRSRSLFVRRQLARWLERDHPAVLGEIDVPRIRALIASEHPDLQVLGARLLREARGVENLRIDEWLALAETRSVEAMTVLVARMSEVVAPARATIAQCVTLARSEIYVAAALGMEWAETKTLTTKEELEAALAILDAPLAPIRARALAWLTPIIRRDDVGLDAHLRELLDARHADVRAHGFRLLEETPRFRDSIVLWAALAESPHPDARAFLLELLSRRKVALDASHLSDRCLHQLWATTLLDIHRGSRAKQRALVQLGERLESQPQRAEAILPLIMLALRSIRETERRSALAALVRAAVRQPEVRKAIAHKIPDLEILGPTDVTAGGA